VRFLNGISYNDSANVSVHGKNRHIFITGGSKGLGVAFAREFATKHGAQVTIVARGEIELQEAVMSIDRVCESMGEVAGKVQAMPCDVTNKDQVKTVIDKAEESFGPIDTLICCAGSAATGEFLKRTTEDFEAQMKLNYLGAVYPTRVVVDNMIKGQQANGRIVLVASQAALMSCCGYSAYSPSKFALRGLGEALRHELLPHSIKVHVAFPGNMNSPGYEIEMKTKPEVTKMIEKGEPLQEPSEVATAMINSLLKDEYALYGGNTSGYFLGRMSHGLAPMGRNLLLDSILAPILVWVAWGHRTFVLDRAAHRYYRSSNVQE